MHQQPGISQAGRSSCDATGEKQIGIDIDLQHSRGERGGPHHLQHLANAGLPPAKVQPQLTQALFCQRWQLHQPLQQGARQGADRQHGGSGPGPCGCADGGPRLQPQQSQTNQHRQAGEQRANGRQPIHIGCVECSKAQANQAGQQGHGGHQPQLQHRQGMQFRIEPWPHQGDQGIGQQHQQQRDHQQPKAHQGVDGGQQLGAVLPFPFGHDADHGAVKRTVDAAQQDQQKPR